MNRYSYRYDIAVVGSSEQVDEVQARQVVPLPVSHEYRQIKR